MSRFWAGFLAASVVWGAGAAIYALGYLDALLGPSPRSTAGAREDAPRRASKQRRRGRRNSRRPKSKYSRPRSGSSGRRPARALDARPQPADVLSGDALGEPGTRELDVSTSGGEEQLTGYDIERGFDSVLPAIRRCLVLVDGDRFLSGRIIFGLRIHGASGVSKVNLRGPAAVTRGEAGSCLRAAARGIAFRRFDGPDMIVHFPLTLE